MTTKSICPVYTECAHRQDTNCGSCPKLVSKGSFSSLKFLHALSTERREFLLMLVAGVTLAGGGLSNWLGFGSLAVVCYGITYLTGGWYGSVKGVQSLRKHVIDVDLLMILAALGAALVGAPFEGGMLLDVALG